jgi:citrate synthase
MDIQSLILEAARKAEEETQNIGEPEFTQKIEWPVSCTVGPGLEGAIACESAVGYVNGTAGKLLYRGYNIFDLCAYSSYEEVSFLLLHEYLPEKKELEEYKRQLITYRSAPKTIRQLAASGIEGLNDMAALRLGILFLRQKVTVTDTVEGRPSIATAISADEDSIPMEKFPTGEERAIYEFSRKEQDSELLKEDSLHACYHLIAAMPTIVAAVYRLREGKKPLEPDPELGHAANFLYMLTGRKPSELEAKIMDVALILHADHGMNASTFATMVVASTLSDIYFSVGSGIAALNGPLHGGANEDVIRTLKEIGRPDRVKSWLAEKLAAGQKIPGFGHRVYKAYDPRARVLGPLAARLAEENPEARKLYEVAAELEKEVIQRLGAKKKVFPNVDFYSGLVYLSLGIEPHAYTPIFAVSRVAGWTARTLEYLKNNRIFRPRAVYTGPFDCQYIPLAERGK